MEEALTWDQIRQRDIAAHESMGAFLKNTLSASNFSTKLRDKLAEADERARKLHELDQHFAEHPEILALLDEFRL